MILNAFALRGVLTSPKIGPASFRALELPIHHVTWPIASCDDSHSVPFHQSVTCSLLGQGSRLVKVRRIQTTVVLGTVLLWAVTPAMACLLASFVPNPAEHACCHHMTEHCGQSAMPTSHACCQPPIYPETVVVQSGTNLPLKNTIAALPTATHAHLSALVAASSRCFAYFQSPPSEAPSCSSSVLRI